MIGTLIVLAVLMWLLQLALGLRQFRKFSRHVKELRKVGPVAIGKAKGRIGAGAVMLLVLDSSQRIVRGELMEGFTILAEFKAFPALDGRSLLELTEEGLDGLPISRAAKKAALAARRDYELYMEENADKDSRVQVIRGE